MSYRLEYVWKAVSEKVRAEAVEFWTQEGAIRDRAQAELRSERLLVIARAENSGRIVAVSTAVSQIQPTMGFSLYSLQMYIGRKHRRLGLAQRIIVRAWEELGARFQAGESRDTLGLLFEISSDKVMRVRNQTVWRDYGMAAVYVGKNAQGHHRRVWYFAATHVPI